MNNRFSTSTWVAVVVATIAFTLIGSAAYAKPKITYTVEKSIEIKQSSNGWNRPSQQYIPVDPHTKAVQKPAAPMKKGEYQINIVYPTKGPLAIRVPPQNTSGRGSLLNATESNSPISASAAGKSQGASSSNDGKNRAKSKTSAVSKAVQEQAAVTPATYEPNYGQTKKRNF